MLGHNFFSHRTIRKIIVAFGSLFNDVMLIRYNEDGKELTRFTVPIIYSTKEKYITRVMSDPELVKSIATNLPRMAFTLEGMSYDPSRKQITTLKNVSVYTPSRTQYVPVPYDFQFSLSIFTRNTEDSTQILEQILPFFTPDFTLTLDLIDEIGKPYNIPVVLNEIKSSTEYEGDFSTTRVVTWDLNFTVKGYLFPPTSEPKYGRIGEWSDVGGEDGLGGYGGIIINLYSDERNRTAQQVKIKPFDGRGVFVSNEVVRVTNRGDNIAGRVVYYSNNNEGVLIIKELNDFLEVGDILVGDYSNAKHEVLYIDRTPRKIVNIYIQSDPLGADPNGDYGFTETLTEYKS